MAQHSVVSVEQLDKGIILAPERYDPRRRSAISDVDGVAVSNIAWIARDIVAPNNADPDYKYLVLNTSDAREGFIVGNAELVDAVGLGSAKKVVNFGDVIISRLRPYLRQVAFADVLLFDRANTRILVVCSTEFYVLRSKDQQSIAFLVPYLLSALVQSILSSSQEGGHHPRFTESSLENLVVPNNIVVNREELSAAIENADDSTRRAEASIQSLIANCSQLGASPI